VSGDIKLGVLFEIAPMVMSQRIKSKGFILTASLHRTQEGGNVQTEGTGGNGIGTRLGGGSKISADGDAMFHRLEGGEKGINHVLRIEPNGNRGGAVWSKQLISLPRIWDTDVLSTHGGRGG